MLLLFTGNDSLRARAALRRALEKHAPGAEVVRVTDAHTMEDLHAALSGGGLFAARRAIVLESVCAREDMRAALLDFLPSLAAFTEVVAVLESELDAATRKRIEKHAETSERFDVPKAATRETIFSLANALRQGKKKDLWVGLQREFASGTSPEAVHGVLWWAAKQSLVRNPGDSHARRHVRELAALPHEARRRGEELDYALERFALSLT